MADLLDYIEWRGDLPLTAAPFNDVDSLILCQLAYVNFDGLVIENPRTAPIPISLVSDMFLNASDYEERLKIGALISPKTNDLLPAMAASRRYSDMKLSCYVNRIDKDEQKQFSALCIDLGIGEHYVSFRGTDDTIVGWKEDFNMSFSTVPSQREAVDYLDSVSNVTKGRLRVGGHSKGGNLAVYGAAFAPDAVRQRIVQVYNNDGPGFEDDVLASSAYKSILEKVKTFVPQSSVIGMLLGHEEPYTVVYSTQKGIMQHDPFSWQVERDGFVLLDTISDGSLLIDRTLKQWISGMNNEQRSKFVDALFGIFDNTDISKVSDFFIDRLKRSGGLLKYLGSADEATRKLVGQSIFQLLMSARNSWAEMNKKNKIPLLKQKNS